MTNWMEQVGVFTLQDYTNLMVSLASWPLYSGQNLLRVVKPGEGRQTFQFVISCASFEISKVLIIFQKARGCIIDPSVVCIQAPVKRYKCLTELWCRAPNELMSHDSVSVLHQHVLFTCYISSMDRTVSDHLFAASFVSVLLGIETIYQEYAENSYNVLV